MYIRSTTLLPLHSSRHRWRNVISWSPTLACELYRSDPVLFERLLRRRPLSPQTIRNLLRAILVRRNAARFVGLWEGTHIGKGIRLPFLNGCSRLIRRDPTIAMLSVLCHVEHARSAFSELPIELVRKIFLRLLRKDERYIEYAPVRLVNDRSFLMAAAPIIQSSSIAERYYSKIQFTPVDDFRLVLTNPPTFIHRSPLAEKYLSDPLAMELICQRSPNMITEADLSVGDFTNLLGNVCIRHLMKKTGDARSTPLYFVPPDRYGCLAAALVKVRKQLPHADLTDLLPGECANLILPFEIHSTVRTVAPKRSTICPVATAADVTE